MLRERSLMNDYADAFDEIIANFTNLRWEERLIQIEMIAHNSPLR